MVESRSPYRPRSVVNVFGGSLAAPPVERYATDEVM